MGVEPTDAGGDLAYRRLARRRQRARVFGSVACDDARPDSDIDLLVELERERSLMDLGGLLSDLEALLGRRVDVVEPAGLHWYIRDRVLVEAVPL